MTTEQAAYGSTSERSDAPRRVRVRHFSRAKEQGIKITGLTSYDFLSATIFDQAGIDFLLVGDSAGNTVFGYDSTLPVTSGTSWSRAQASSSSSARGVIRSSASQKPR